MDSSTQENLAPSRSRSPQPTETEEPTQTVPAEYSITMMAFPTTTQESRLTGMLTTCSGFSDLPTFSLCFQKTTKSNFLAQEDLAERYWNLFGGDLPEDADVRPLLVIVTSEEEFVSLELCEDAWDLCECILHALLGWLAAYEQGWMQRDPSIGRIVKLKHARGRIPLHSSLSETPHPSDDFDYRFTILSGKDGDPKLLQLRQDLDNALNSFGEINECKAILCDFDLSPRLGSYLARNPRKGLKISGTGQLMSTSLHECLRRKSPHLVTPPDDFWAFLHTTAWATLFNVNYQPLSMDPEGKRWRSFFQGNSHDRDFVVERMGYTQIFAVPLMVKSMRCVLRNWSSQLNDMVDKWVESIFELGEESLVDSDEVVYEGVIAFVEILVQFKDTLKPTTAT
ncbi:hypothetical protein DL96DRAFT_1579713 [Flagelloscypha sp. PMI_526]|nr:hypothetical protein DL96DRAFT_1579713 [Flagelloscypha sp. PMI_526]